MIPALLLMLGALVPAAPPGAPDAAALLRDSDRARGGLEKGVTWTLTVTSTEEGTTTRRTMNVRARNTDAVVETTAPPRQKGEVILFNDRSLWFLKPGLRRPIAISARQRLQGDASNGDVASTNYARDYAGTIVGEEVVEGEPAWKLDLVARSKDVTYDRIRYWISKRRRLGMKAEFLTVGGDVFKTATFEYGNRVRIPSGEQIDFVSRMTIRDAMGAGGVTVLTYESPRAETHAPSIFNVNNVGR
jgi:Outer membrane lipoprotein-sorting protein